MRKNGILITSTTFAILCVFFVMTSMSVFAGNLGAGTGIEPHPPIPQTFDDPSEEAQTELVSEFTSINGNTSDGRALESINPHIITYRSGAPEAGEIVTYTYILRPEATDDESVDGFLLYLPENWELLGYSAAPVKNNAACDGVALKDDGFANGRYVVYWGNNLTAPANLDNPPDDLERSGCGIYATDNESEISVWVRVRVDHAAMTCPGTETFVGTPYDGQIFEAPYSPLIEKSMVMFMFGAGTETSMSTVPISMVDACPQPNVRVEKFVSLPGNCPNSFINEYVVQSGTEVEYCYKLWNDSSYLSAISNTLTDDRIGMVALPGFVLPANSWTYLSLTDTISGSVGSLITNTATWESGTTSGYGQDPQNNYSAPFTTTSYLGSASDMASVEIVEKANFLYMPWISYAHLYTLPVQITPTNGAHLDTLIPELGIDGEAATSYDFIRIYLGTSRYDLDLIASLEGDTETYNFTSNLEPATKYYWRVCYAESAADTDHQCSAFWWFITGSIGSLPATPVLDSPADGATGVDPDEVIVSWAAADDAEFYEVTLHPIDSAYNYVITTNGLSVDYSSYWDFDLDTQHEWRVRGKNSYGWGDYSTTWTFTTAESD